MLSVSDIENLWVKVFEEVENNFPDYYNLILENSYTWEVVSKKSNNLGLCDHNKRLLTLNHYMHKNSSEELIRDTMLHEVAHAIDFCQRGRSDHGVVWKALASELGATPAACSKTAMDVEYKYVVVHKGEEGYRLLRGIHRKSNGYKINACMEDRYLRGKPETKGQIYLLSWDRWLEVKGE